MAKHKHIFWRHDLPLNDRGEMFANVHLLEGYSQASINDFKRMAEELRETFPQATDDEICGGRITKSDRYNGFTIIVWNAHIPREDYTDWIQKDNVPIDYNW